MAYMGAADDGDTDDTDMTASEFEDAMAHGIPVDLAVGSTAVFQWLPDVGTREVLSINGGATSSVIAAGGAYFSPAVRSKVQPV